MLFSKETTGHPIFHHVAIEVRNVTKSKSFYEQLLGFHEEMRMEALGEKLVFLLLGTFRLELIESNDIDTRSAGMHLCFYVPNIHTIMTKLKEMGIPVLEGPFLFHNGWQSIFIKGYDMEIIEFLQTMD